MKNIQPKYKLIGHRGVGGLRPENTYCSFEYAAELGLNWIEFDVQLTKDEQWVVMHDETIDRTTNGHGKVCEYTLTQIEQIQAGMWYQPAYSKQPVPSLIKTMQLSKALGLNLNIEIKGSESDPEKHAALLAQFIKQNLSLQTQILISSFDLTCITAVRKLLPKIAVGYLIDYFTEQTIDIAKTNNFESINCDVNTITEYDIKMATAHKLPVLLYTINDKTLAKFWFDRGIAAIFTDRPDLVL